MTEIRLILKIAERENAKLLEVWNEFFGRKSGKRHGQRETLSVEQTDGRTITAP